MTVLCGGLSGGRLYDAVDVADFGIRYRTFVPMLEMTAEDLGGKTEEGGGVRWPFCTTGDCEPGPCAIYGQCFYFGLPVS